MIYVQCITVQESGPIIYDGEQDNSPSDNSPPDNCPPRTIAPLGQLPPTNCFQFYFSF